MWLRATNGLRLAQLVVACWLLAMSTALASNPDVVGYHRSGTRDGHYEVTGLTWARAASMHLDKAFAGFYSGSVYAQPLYWLPPGAAHGILFVATEENVAVALDAHTGQQIWSRELGTPVREGSSGCSLIRSVGITGTPVLDPATGVVYFDSLQSTSDGVQHLVYAISLADGSTLAGWPIEVTRAVGWLDPMLQDQRSALTLLNGRLYVAYANDSSDCGVVEGHPGLVVGIDPPRHTVTGYWKAEGFGGGIWALGGLSDDGVSLFAATGNTYSANTWAGGEAILRLPPALTFPSDVHDYFAPADWQKLDKHDLDLGSTGPLLIDLPVAGGVSQKIVLAMGKSGEAFILDRGKLGGIGGQRLRLRISDGRIITAPAVYPLPGSVGVVLELRQKPALGCPQPVSVPSLVALRISGGHPPGVAVVWCASLRGSGAPIVTTSGSEGEQIVWIVEGGGSIGQLRGYRADTGAAVFTGGKSIDHLGRTSPSVTPIAAEGHLYVAGLNQIVAFTFDR